MGRISSVTTQQNNAAVSQTVVWNVTWNPYGPLASMSFGYGANAIFTTDTDYRITRVQVGGSGNPGGTIDRSLSWTGDIVASIVDNLNPGTTPGQYGSQSQSFTYTPTRRLSSASGYYGALSWSSDANGNRLTETANGVTSTYAYPSTSNLLSSVTPAGGTARAFAYDASGNIVTDTRTGALGMTLQYDVENRLSGVYQTNAPSQAATYAYDAQDRLALRAVNGVTRLYIHDLNNHIIAETDTTGATLREYIWLNDLPVAVVDGANTASPTLYYVHTDHLGRPLRMIAQDWSWVWDVIYSPFGGTSYLWDNTAKLNARFPGQWFQLESGLAYNWHRHYDATLGRYVQPDPIGYAGGRNLYGYVGGNPLAYVDPRGLDWSSDFRNYISESYRRLADVPRQFMNDPSGSIQSGLESTPAVAPELAALRGAKRLANAVQAANEANGNGQGYCSPLNIDPSQFGKKAAKHMPDFNLDPSNAADRKAFEDIVKDIANTPDFVRDGTWSGASPNGIPAQFRIKGQDVVITSPDGNFITILRNGADQASVINSLK